jgi:hypothetical protein
VVKQPYFVVSAWSTPPSLDKKTPVFLNFDVTRAPNVSYAGVMTNRNESRARRTALVTAAATLALWGSFGTAVHADDEPVTEPPVETGEVGGATVAVGPPPVPPTSVVVAVGQPPVPPTSVVVAVGQPPVPPAPAAAPPANTPAVTASAQAPQVARPHALRQAVGVSDQLTEVFADVIATIEAALALINSQL